MTTGVAEPDVDAAAEIATGDGNDDDDGLSHWHCCLPDRALCGARLGGEPCPDGEDVECVVCRGMEDLPCEVTCHPYLGEVS